MKMKIFTFLLVVLALPMICPVPVFAQSSSFVQFQQFPQAPTVTPLAPLWPYIPAILSSYVASQFNVGDFVCFDVINSPYPSAGILYVVDNGQVRCPPNMPQVGVVSFTDVAPTTSHTVLIIAGAPPAVITCPLSSCSTAMAQMMPPCDAVRTTQCVK